MTASAGTLATSSSRVYYAMASECSRGRFGSGSENKFVEIENLAETWENVRFLIEERLGIHSEKNKNKKTAWAHIDGFEYNQDDGRVYSKRTPLTAGHIIQKDTKIVCIRRPSEHRPWRPVKYRKRIKGLPRPPEGSCARPLFTPDMDEDARIAALVKSEPFGHSQGHNNRSLKRVSPPSCYICFRCGLAGHWKSACPTLTDPAFRSQNNLRPTTGIPRKFLRKVDREVGDGNPTPHGMFDLTSGELVYCVENGKEFEKHVMQKQNSKLKYMPQTEVMDEEINEEINEE